LVKNACGLQEWRLDRQQLGRAQFLKRYSTIRGRFRFDACPRHRLRQHFRKQWRQGAVIWGDHNTFVDNILYNNNEIAGAATGAQAGLYSGTTNSVQHNLTWSTSDPGGKRSGWYVKEGCCLKDNLIADPSFLDPARHNWDLKPSSPASEWADRVSTKLR